ncbi:MliC family protein [Enterovirga rhinocerotis]|uniref:Membrane-bound inhibitor of C-type lysozyme n=1 Tax=Enterovirga rhinocerotis TaxID=1339210 RepID=A0A4R7C7Y3_9HYPH|nr:MliC family protein [Enterovirga rhinocerotis]TDR94740.1 membrane-bound inhibitor of C-type lysozyme [Enterovirga rhinocerotis]
MDYRRMGLAAALSVVAAGAAQATEAQYECSGGTRLLAQFSPPGAPNGHVVLTFTGSDRKLRLPQAMSADGGRYVGDGIEFWIKGRGATLTRGDQRETCTSP